MQKNVFEELTYYNVKPFLRWAGGKTWLASHLSNYLPLSFNNYHEPFIGGGSVFLYLKAKGYIKHSSYLSDLNDELINSYNILKEQSNSLFKLLKNFTNDSECYYAIRSSKPETKLEQAAKFIYLNRTSFNGIYRINRQGQYNVPFGNRSLSVVFEYENMSNVSSMIQKSSFESTDFFNTVHNINEGDLVFLDPPYTIAHEHNGFIEYNHKIFAWADQERLRAYIDLIRHKGAYFILTNAAHYSIEALYDGIGSKKIISRSSTVGGIGANRAKCNEYIYTNYEGKQ